MTENTINNDMTTGGAAATLLAGRYSVVRQLGQGGMGSVWLAEDTKLDGFKVAIKMLPSVLVNNKRAYRQVKAEALVSLKLLHQNIVPVRAFEEVDGAPFLVMDYIDGQTLDDYLAEKGKLTEDETVKLLKPVAGALDYAHTQGVVHRDVKPGNVMIRKDGTPFVLDFGIAREIQETMTRVTGKLSSGTLMYMSPEQLNGEAPKPAQDVYSFAAMAYECLKGEPPFCRGQIEYQIIHNKPDPFSVETPFVVNVLCGLSKNPVLRPQTCLKFFEQQVSRVEHHSSPRGDAALKVPYDDLRFVPRADRPWYLQGATRNHLGEDEDLQTISNRQKGAMHKVASLDEIPQEDRRFLPAENRKEIAGEEERAAKDGWKRHEVWGWRSLIFGLVILAGIIVGVVLQWDEVIKLYEEVRLSYLR